MQTVHLRTCRKPYYVLYMSWRDGHCRFVLSTRCRLTTVGSIGFNNRSKFVHRLCSYFSFYLYLLFLDFSMFFEKFVLGCICLSMRPFVLRCQSDASFEMRESNLSQPGAGFEARRFVDDGIGNVKLVLDNRDMAPMDYQKFDIDGQRLARDIDSVESNVNVNVNSLTSSGLPWNMQRETRVNRLPQSTAFGRNRKNRVDRIMQLIHQMPNSNFDYNHASDDHARLKRKRNFRVKTQRVAPDEDSEEMLPDLPTDSAPNQCEPIVNKVVEYLRLVENNLRNLENDLWSFLGEPNYNSA